MGSLSSLRSKSSTSAPASSAADSARRSALRLLELLLRVPPIPTTLVQRFSKTIPLLPFSINLSSINELLLRRRKVGVQVGAHLRQEPVEGPVLPDAHTREGFLFNPLPAAGDRPLDAEPVGELAAPQAVSLPQLDQDHLLADVEPDLREQLPDVAPVRPADLR